MNQKKEEMLEQIRACLSDLHAVTAQHDYLRGELAVALAEVDRAAHRFDSPLTILVSMGMLKAGKSTLVNLLARNQNASPIGYGVDTTLRPAMIRPVSHPTGTISIYRRMPESDAAKDLADLLDVFRGLHTDPRSWDIRRKQLALNNDNLLDVLCRRASESEILSSWGGEPLLVVVEIPRPEEGLLSSPDCMLLDMPGLDSDIGGIFSGLQYEELVQECDMVMFVQSSVAPLNREALRSLSDMMPGRSMRNFWGILNRMASKSWRHREELEKDLHHQESRARQILSTLGREGLQSRSVNLGMAYDGYFANPVDLNREYKLESGELVTNDTLKAASHFHQLELALIDARDHDEERLGLRFSHCLDDFRLRVKALREVFDVQLKTAREDKEKAEHEIEIWNKVQKEVRRLLDPAVLEWPVSSELHLRKKIDYPACVLTSKGKSRFTSWINSSRKVAGRDLNAFLDDCYAETAKTIKNRLSTLTVGDVVMANDDLLSREANHKLDAALMKFTTTLLKDSGELKPYFTRLELEIPRLSAADKPLNLKLEPDYLPTVCPEHYTETEEIEFWHLDWDWLPNWLKDFSIIKTVRLENNPEKPLYAERLHHLFVTMEQKVQTLLSEQAFAAMQQTVAALLSQQQRRHESAIRTFLAESEKSLAAAESTLALLNDYSSHLEQLETLCKK